MNNFFNNMISLATRGIASGSLGMPAYVLYELLGGEPNNIQENVANMYNLYNDWSKSGQINSDQEFLEKLGGQLANMNKPMAQSLSDLMSSTTGQTAIGERAKQEQYFTSQNLLNYNNNKEITDSMMNSIMR